MLTPAQKLELRSRALAALAQTDSGVDGVAAYIEAVFGYVPAPHHRQMLADILDAVYHRENIVILEPRGAAKTTIGNTGFLSWLIARFPDIRVGLISNTSRQSNDFSRAIRVTYESNAAHRDIFGDCVSPTKWTDVEWLRRGSRWHGSKDVTLFSVGVAGATISKRFDLILCDDILDEENCANPEQREKVETWFFKTLLPCLTPDGVVVMLGTRWAEGDLYEILTKRKKDGGKGWRSRVVSALTTDADGTMQSYWPNVWPVEALLEKKEELGSALFSCAFQNDISGLLEGNVFKGPFDHFSELPPDHRYTMKMGIDLASSEKESADYTARVTTAVDTCQSDCSRKGHFYVLSAYRDRRESHHAEFIYDGYAAYPEIGLVIVESQQFQSTLIAEVMEDYPHIPIEGRRSDTDKVTRARAVAAKYEAHKVHHHASLRGTAFEVELLSFPKGHDDLVDALGFSMDLGGGGFIFGAMRR